ncbi:hypothetical protein ACFLTN_02410 [Chloroflexota bacterium]
MMRKIPQLGLVILIVSSLVLNGCWLESLNIPNAKDLCLSVWPSDFYELNYWPDEEPIPHDEFSKEYAPYPKYPNSDYETCYSRVFWMEDMCEIHGLHIELASGFCIGNQVRVYRSVEKSKKAFVNMGAPRFAFSEDNIVGTPGKEWNIAQVGDESKAWRFTSSVLDEKEERLITQHETEMCFRKEYVISSVSVTTWGDDLQETEAFLLDVALVSEAKISKSISSR